MVPKYVLKIHIDEASARAIINNPKIRKHASAVENEIYYKDGVLVLSSSTGLDVDEELISMVIDAYGKPAKAEAYIVYGNGRERKIFDGTLDPRKPLSIHPSKEEEEEEEEFEEEYDEEELDLFNEEDFYDEEEYYDEEEEEY